MNLFLYALLCLIWGSTWMAIKVGLRDAPSVTSAALRFILALAVVLIINALQRNRYPSGWRDKWRVAWVGMFNYFASYAFVYIGSRFINSSLASILFAIYPFVVMLLVPLMVKSEKVTLRALIGSLIGFGGVVLIFAEPVQFGGKELLGMLLILGSPLCSAFATVSVKARLHDEPIMPMLALQMAVGAILLTTTALLFEDVTAFRFTAASVGTIVYLALFGTVFCFAAFFWLLKRLSLVTMSLIAFITPLVALLLGTLALDEQLGSYDYLGAGLVLVGVLIVNVQLNRRKRRDDTAALLALDDHA